MTPAQPAVLARPLVFEVKVDGWRMLSDKSRDDVRLVPSPVIPLEKPLTSTANPFLGHLHGVYWRR